MTRSGRARLFLPVLMSSALAVPPLLHARQSAPGVEGLLRGRIESLRAGFITQAGGETLRARQALPRFYENAGFVPVWIPPADSGGHLASLLDALRSAEAHGLDPIDYHSDVIVTLRQRAVNGTATPAELVDLELLASDAFMVFGSHLLHGRVNPETIDPEWLANRRNAELHGVLADAVATRKIEETLLRLAPQQPRYAAMMTAATALREIARAGGWPRIASGAKLEIGVEDPRVVTLRERLHASGDLERDAVGPGVSADEGFDEALDAAVRSFQNRHGLDVDGVVGPATLAAMNVPAADRARQIAINMERWRWLPSDLGERHLEVNIAGFEVKVVEDGRTVRVHRAVVGRQYRETPMFSGAMTYLVLSPYWHVPPTIAAVDKLPLIKRDRGVLTTQRMTLLDQRTNQSVDPASVDWASVSGRDFNRRYR